MAARFLILLLVLSICIFYKSSASATTLRGVAVDALDGETINVKVDNRLVTYEGVRPSILRFSILWAGNNFVVTALTVEQKQVYCYGIKLAHAGESKNRRIEGLTPVYAENAVSGSP